MARQVNNPNQKVITVHREPKKEKGYTYFNLEALNEARANLKPGAFVLWTYIAQNSDGWEFGLSNTDFCGGSTMKRDAYNTAVAELIEKRYLVLNRGKTVYDFYERPPKDDSGSVAEKSNNDNPLQENPITKSRKIQQRNADKSDNEMQENPTRNIIKDDTTTITTIPQAPSIDSPSELASSLTSSAIDVAQQEPKSWSEVTKGTMVSSISQLMDDCKEHVEGSIWKIHKGTEWIVVDISK